MEVRRKKCGGEREKVWRCLHGVRGADEGVIRVAGEGGRSTFEGVRGAGEGKRGYAFVRIG